MEHFYQNIQGWLTDALMIEINQCRNLVVQQT